MGRKRFIFGTETSRGPRRPCRRMMDGWMARFYVLFNSISVISVQWADDNEKAVCSRTPFTVKKSSPRAGIDPGPLDQ